MNCYLCVSLNIFPIKKSTYFLTALVSKVETASLDVTTPV